MVGEEPEVNGRKQVRVFIVMRKEREDSQWRSGIG